MKKTVVVTGMGLVTPLKPFKGLDTFWDALCLGEDAVKRMPPPILDTGREWLMACIDPLVFPDSVRLENKLMFIAERALNMALEDSGLETAVAGHEAPVIGLITGTVLGNVMCKERRLIDQKIGKGNDNNEMELLSFPCPYLAGKYNLLGPNMTVSTACASGTDAIGIAAREIVAGKSHIMIAGGVDVLSDFALIGFNALQALTDDKIRPFDRNRSGLALGEGAAFIVLESKEHAVDRGAKLYGQIMGYSSRADAHHLTGPHKEGRGLADAVGQAIIEANLLPQDISYINAHGTGTIYNDLMETKVVKKVFGENAYGIPISSTKSMLGHSFGAAGAIEAICCILAVKRNIIPPTINLCEKDPECDLDYVPHTARKQDLKVAMSMSAGFGGQNSVLIAGVI